MQLSCFQTKRQHFRNVLFVHRKKCYKLYENNLIAKEEILTRFNAFNLSDDLNTNREQLKAFASEFTNAGMVPLKDKKRINDVFYARLDELYDKLNIDKNEKAVMQFKTKLERFAASENALDLLKKEGDFIKKIADEINNNVRTYENNLGFFKNSKGSNSFMQEIEAKIETEKGKLTELANKRKLINEELGKIRIYKSLQYG